jgi:hypothetical protein
MSDYQLSTPVVFAIFKRPETTAKVFETIRQAKPPKLFVIADGPRLHVPGEAEQCAATRAIIDRVDWDCEVFTNYSETNLGCGKRLSSGLDWVFDNVEEAIILEDDCLPDPSFFRFCEELLDKYRDDCRIFSISGQNVQFGRQRTEYSYYFSRYNHSWGWATWKRAWQYFDFDMKLWPEAQAKEVLNDILPDAATARFWTNVFQSTYLEHRNIWDYQWTFTCWIQGASCILSNTNLISNIGFGEGSTNTPNINSKYSNIPSIEMQFPLKHPPFLIRDAKADSFTQNTLFNYGDLKHQIKKKIQTRLKQILK